MLRTLLFLALLVAPLVHAQGTNDPVDNTNNDNTETQEEVQVFFPTVYDAPLLADGDSVTVTDDALVLDADESNTASRSAADSISALEITATGPIEGVIAEMYGNLVLSEDFPCSPSTTALTSFNSFAFTSSTGSTFLCQLTTHTGTSSSIQLARGNNDASWHTISKTISMVASGQSVVVKFWLYSSPTSVSVSDIGITTQVGTGSVSNPARPDSSSGSGWRQYTAQLNIVGTINDFGNKDVTFTITISRPAVGVQSTLPTVYIDDISIGYTNFIKAPSGDRIFYETFDGCHSSDTSFSQALSSYWAQSTLNAHMACVHNAQLSVSSSGSMIMANQDVIPPLSWMSSAIGRRTQDRLLAGKEITLEFWMRWQDGTLVQRPTVAVYVQLESLELQDLLQNLVPIAAPRVVDDGSVPQYNGFYRYRTVYTLPGNTDRYARFVIRIQQAREINILNWNTRYTSTFYIDNILCQYSTHSTPSVHGDPSFVGLYNQNYQVHGIDGAIYNLVSSPTTQVNSRFVFLNEGRCPIFGGIPAANCWAHPGSYLGAIGVQEIVGGVNHKLEIVAGSAAEGFASVILDGMKLSLNDSVAHGDVFDVTFVSSHTVMVNTAVFAFTFENSDMFINQGVAAHRPLSQLTCHGLFGQTHKRAVYPTKLKYIEGEVDDYLIAEDNLFGTDFVYNQFHSS